MKKYIIDPKYDMKLFETVQSLMINAHASELGSNVVKDCIYYLKAFFFMSNAMPTARKTAKNTPWK